MADVLIIDDDHEVCGLLIEMIRGVNHSAMYAHTIGEGITKIGSHLFDVVFLDVQLPDGSGLDLLPKIRETSNAPEVIIMTGEGDPDGAQTAIESGAWDYLQKPLDSKKILLSMHRVLQYRANLSSVKQTPTPLRFDGFVGKSQRMQEVFALMAQAAATNANVLITGETGTGKELFAKAVHDNSKRSKQNFVVVDCASLQDTLIESELFGHEKGAFTGADQSSAGLVSQANYGTLFLDEVGELAPSAQKKFLRILQERRYRPVGGKAEVTSDFRLIAATNRNLGQRVSEGFFRADLFYRLNTFVIYLPPLRDYQEDMNALIVYQANNICKRNNIQPKGFAADFLDVLSAYHWPGNIRELFHALEVSVVNSLNEQVLFTKHIPQNIRAEVARLSVSEQKKQDRNLPQSQGVTSLDFPKFRQYRESHLAQLEKDYFKNLMKQTKGNIKSACELSGLGRSRLYNLLNKHQVSRSGWDA